MHARFHSLCIYASILQFQAHSEESHTHIHTHSYEHRFETNACVWWQNKKNISYVSTDL